MSTISNEFGKFAYFLHLDETGNYIKNTNAKELNSYDKKIIYFNSPSEPGEDCCVKHLKHSVSFDKFPWISYLKLNHDLSNAGCETKEQAWHHWIHYGIKEERSYSFINNSHLHQGRFGNIFFINLYLHFMSIKYDSRCKYKHEKAFNRLGIFFHKGATIYKKNCLITDDNFLTVFHNKTFEPANLILKDVWFQTKDFCCMLKAYFNDEKIKSKIIENNVYKNRFQTNNDLFIHLRLGDVSQKTKSKKKYYEELLNEMEYNNGFISSDSPEDPFFQELVEKYKLTIIDYDEIRTIMFACTCNNIILSGGTYSWLIGFLAFYTKYIYYPDLEDTWYGNIFSFSNWIKI